MSPNKRIFLNIVATYGRSLFALACGLFSARWVLEALGQEDFGLYGVVGGLVAFIGIVNSLLGCAVGRFYAVSVGAAHVAADKDAALYECRVWFSTAVLVHTVVPLVLMLIGEPLGEYAIRAGWIVVPPNRLAECLWVFRFACLASFVSMVGVPFQSLYTAKQYIAELTLYGFATSLLNLGFFYYMVTHPGVWLAKYGAWTAAMLILPAVIIALRACSVFPECRLIVDEMWNGSRIRQLTAFAGWQAFGGLGCVIRSQGMAILLNRHTEFGSARNSSMTVANQVAAQTDTLSGAMVGAFQPAIANAYGAKDYDRMRSLAFRACKFGTLLSAVFVLPLALELPAVLGIWLKEPPEYAAGLCWCILAAHLVDRTAVGHMLAVAATGKIAAYQAFLGGSLILTLPLAWLFVRLHWGIYATGWAMILTMMLCAWGRVWFARTIAGLSAWHWLKKIFLPLAAVMGCTLALGALPRLALPAGWLRLGATTLACETALGALAWGCVLDGQEKNFICYKLKRLVNLLMKDL